MLHDVIVRHHRHVDQWKRTAIQRLRQLRVGKFIQPVEGKRIRTGCTVIKSIGTTSGSVLCPASGGAALRQSHSASGERPYGYPVSSGALSPRKHTPCRRWSAPTRGHLNTGAQILINKARRLQPQGREIAPLKDRFGKVEGEEISRCLRVTKKSLKDRIVRRRGHPFFMAIRLPEREGKPDSIIGFTRLGLTTIFWEAPRRIAWRPARLAAINTA